MVRGRVQRVCLVCARVCFCGVGGDLMKPSGYGFGRFGSLLTNGDLEGIDALNGQFGMKLGGTRPVSATLGPTDFYDISIWDGETSLERDRNFFQFGSHGSSVCFQPKHFGSEWLGGLDRWKIKLVRFLSGGISSGNGVALKNTCLQELLEFNLASRINLESQLCSCLNP